MVRSRVLQGVEAKMVRGMICVKGKSAITPLGDTPAENLDRMIENKSMLTQHAQDFQMSEGCHVSLFDRNEVESKFKSPGKEEFSLFETLCIRACEKALKDSDGINPASNDTVFVISSTKGNVEYLSEDLADERCYIGTSARKIAEYFGNTNTPIIASNACISGVCAQIVAIRELLAGRYKNAVVVGCDVLSEFIISGFQSFKALSGEDCRPFDKSRVGLNLGEAAAAMVLTRVEDTEDVKWKYINSSIHNDANHISGPSRTGEGSFRVLKDITKCIAKEEIAFVNAHGTATVYNDEMESIALHRAGLDEIPLNGMKGYFGHTLGAAGILETVLSMTAVERNIIPATRGYKDCGTTYPLNISNETRYTDKRCFIKILSGFGGSNAGIAYKYMG